MASRAILRASVVPASLRGLGASRRQTTLSQAEVSGSTQTCPLTTQHQTSDATGDTLCVAPSERSFGSGDPQANTQHSPNASSYVPPAELSPEAPVETTSPPAYSPYAPRSLYGLPPTATAATDRPTPPPRPLGMNKAQWRDVNKALDDAARGMGPSPSRMQFDLCLANMSSELVPKFTDRAKLLAYLEWALKARINSSPIPSTTAKDQPETTQQETDEPAMTRVRIGDLSRVVTCIDDLPRKEREILDLAIENSRRSLGENPSGQRIVRYSKVVAYHLQQSLGDSVELDWLLGEIEQRLSPQGRSYPAPPADGNDKGQQPASAQDLPIDPRTSQFEQAGDQETRVTEAESLASQPTAIDRQISSEYRGDQGTEVRGAYIPDDIRPKAHAQEETNPKEVAAQSEKRDDSEGSAANTLDETSDEAEGKDLSLPDEVIDDTAKRILLAFGLSASRYGRIFLLGKIYNEIRLSHPDVPVSRSRIWLALKNILESPLRTSFKELQPRRFDELSEEERRVLDDVYEKAVLGIGHLYPENRQLVAGTICRMVPELCDVIDLNNHIERRLLKRKPQPSGNAAGTKSTGDPAASKSKQKLVVAGATPAAWQPVQKSGVAESKPGSEDASEHPSGTTDTNLSTDQQQVDMVANGFIRDMDPFLTEKQFKQYKRDVLTKLQDQFGRDTHVYDSMAERLETSRQRKLDHYWNHSFNKRRRHSLLRSTSQAIMKPSIARKDWTRLLSRAESAPLQVSTLDLTPEGLLPAGQFWKLPDGDKALPEDRVIIEHPAVALMGALRAQEGNDGTSGCPTFWVDASVSLLSLQVPIGGMGVVFQQGSASHSLLEDQWTQKAFVAAFNTRKTEFFELLAIAQAVQIASTMAPAAAGDQRVVKIYTDCQPALIALKGSAELSSENLPSLAKSLAVQVVQAIEFLEAQASCRVELHWIPGHQFIPGHGVAHHSASRAVKREVARRQEMQHKEPTETKDGAGTTEVGMLTDMQRTLRQLEDNIKQVLSSNGELKTRVDRLEAMSQADSQKIAMQSDIPKERGPKGKTLISEMNSRTKALERKVDIHTSHETITQDNLSNEIPSSVLQLERAFQDIAAVIDNQTLQAVTADDTDQLFQAAKHVYRTYNKLRAFHDNLQTSVGTLRRRLLKVSQVVNEMGGDIGPKKLVTMKDGAVEDIVSLSVTAAVLAQLNQNALRLIKRVEFKSLALAAALDDAVKLSPSWARLLRRGNESLLNKKAYIYSVRGGLKAQIQKVNKILRKLGVSPNDPNMGIKYEEIKAKLQGSPNSVIQLRGKLAATKQELRAVLNANRKLKTRFNDMSAATEKANRQTLTEVDGDAAVEGIDLMLREVMAKNAALEERTSRLEAENQALREQQLAAEDRDEQNDEQKSYFSKVREVFLGR